MKRSLILSVIMTFVLIIAMSTATFAWYNQSTSVSATMTDLTAVSAVGYLRISSDGGETWGSQATILGNSSYQYKPASPLTEKLAGASWIVGFKNADGVFELSSPASDDYYLKSYQLLLKNEGQDDLSVAISSAAYAAANDLEASRSLVAQSAYAIVMGDTVINTGGYNFGKVADANIDGGFKPAGSAISSNQSIEILAGQTVVINVYNWIDGWVATDIASGGSVKFNINFAKA